MKRLLLLLCLVILLAPSCTKDKEFPELSGTWVEKSHLQDRIVFDNSSRKDFFGYPYFELRSEAYADAPPQGFFGRPHKLRYSYFFRNDSIHLHFDLSSTMAFYEPCYFEWAPDKKSFTIKRFYQRTTLPENLVFEKILP